MSNNIPNSKKQPSIINRHATQNQDFKITLKSITDRMIQLSNKVQKLISITGRNKNQQYLLANIHDKLQEFSTVGYGDVYTRFTNASNGVLISDFQPIVAEPEGVRQDQNKITILVDWLFRLCKSLLDIGINVLKSGQSSIQQVKCYISQFLISNLLQISQQNPITSTQFQKIDKHLIQQIFPYFHMKNTPKEQKQFSKSFMDNIKFIANNYHQNNILEKSGVVFTLLRQQNYEREIMKIINYIRKIPYQIVSRKEKNTGGFDYEIIQTTLANQFVMQIQKTFQKSQSDKHKQQTVKLKNDVISPRSNSINVASKFLFPPSPLSPQAQQVQKFNSGPYKEIDSATQFSRNSKQKILTHHQNQQLQNAKNYFAYEIAQKITDQCQEFSQDQINSGCLKIQGQETSQILEKWCVQLEGCFEEGYFLDRIGYVQEEDGEQIQLDGYQLRALNIFFQKQKHQIINKLQNLMENKHNLLSQFSREQVSAHKFSKHSKKQILLSYFCSHMQKIKQTYILYYINMLMHGINRAAARFVKFNQLWKSKGSNGTQNNQNLFQKVIKQVFAFDIQETMEREKFNIPQMIGLSVDIFKCKIISKQSELLKIYKKIQQLHKKDPKTMKILSIKQAAQKKKKSIILKLLYKQLANVEIELTLKPERINYDANRLSVFLLELSKSKFGPLIQMARIYAMQDGLNKFFQDWEDKEIREIGRQSTNVLLSKNTKINNCCRITKNQISQQLPFICKNCQIFYHNCKKTQGHLKCSNCKNQICFSCIFYNSNLENKLELIPVLKNIYGANPKQFIFFQGQLPQRGIIVDLRSSIREAKLFQVLVNKKEYYLFVEKNNDNISQINKKAQKQYILLQKFPSKRPSQTFQKQHIILTYPDLQSKPPPQSLSAAFYTKTKMQNQSYILRNQNFSKKFDQIFKQNQIIQILKSGKKMLDYSKSVKKRKNVRDLVTRYPDVSVVNLSNNHIEGMFCDNIANWWRVTELNLSNNRISDIKDICQNFSILQILDVSHNKISHLPSELQKLTSLQHLNLSSNPLKDTLFSQQSFPSPLNSLKQLILNNTQLSTKLQYLSKYVPNLQRLQLQRNQLLEGMGDGFAEMKLLKKLLFVGNGKVKDLGEGLGGLQELEVYQSELTKLSDNIKKQNQLQKLILSGNKSLKLLPQKFPNYSNLSHLQISTSPLLQTLPPTFDQLSCLKILELSNNQNLKYLPLTFGYLKNLQVLILKQNNILEDLPQSIGYLQKLKSFVIVGNDKIKFLPCTFGGLACLEELIIYHSGIRSLSNCFWKLPTLAYMQLIGNKYLKQIKYNLTNMRSLKNLIMEVTYFKDLKSTGLKNQLQQQIKLNLYKQIKQLKEKQITEGIKPTNNKINNNNKQQQARINCLEATLYMNNKIKNGRDKQTQIKLMQEEENKKLQIELKNPKLDLNLQGQDKVKFQLCHQRDMLKLKYHGYLRNGLVIDTNDNDSNHSSNPNNNNINNNNINNNSMNDNIQTNNNRMQIETSINYPINNNNNNLIQKPNNPRVPPSTIYNINGIPNNNLSANKISNNPINITNSIHSINSPNNPNYTSSQINPISIPNVNSLLDTNNKNNNNNYNMIRQSKTDQRLNANNK